MVAVSISQNTCRQNIESVWLDSGCWQAGLGSGLLRWKQITSSSVGSKEAGTSPGLQGSSTKKRTRIDSWSSFSFTFGLKVQILDDVCVS